MNGGESYEGFIGPIKWDMPEVGKTYFMYHCEVCQSSILGEEGLAEHAQVCYSDDKFCCLGFNQSSLVFECKDCGEVMEGLESKLEHECEE